MRGGPGTMAGGPDHGYAAYQHSSSSASFSTSASGHRSPFSYAPPSSSSQPTSSSFAFARPMRSPSPRPGAMNSAPANIPRSGEGIGRGEDVSYGDDEDEIDSRSPSASHSSLPSAAKKIRRTHARRSCLACRKRKARCELPDITVPSSMDPLPYTVKCHRCKTLDTDCVVWDGDRKMKGDRPARYSPPQDKIAAGKGRSTSRSQASAGRSPLVEQADGSGDSDTARKMRKAPPLITSHNQHASPLRFSMREPHLEHDYEQAVPNLRTIPIPAPTVEHCRARNLPVSTEEMVDNIGTWSDVDDPAGGRPATNDSSSRQSSKGSSTSGAYAANHRRSSDALLSRTAPSTSGHHRPSSRREKGSRSLTTNVFAGIKAEASTGKSHARDYRIKLMNATGRNAALMSEIIYGAPEYRARAREGETVAYAYRGVPVVDEGTVPRDKVEALIRAHPFLSPELVNSVPEDADPNSGRVFLSNVVNYLCLKPNPPPDLTSFVIRHSSIHVIMQSRNRETCQALLLLVLYEPSDMQLGKPAQDADVQLDHSPGHHLYHAAMNCALSLGLDRVIPSLGAGPDALEPNSNVQRRMSRLRDAALWLTVSSMGVGQAFSSTRPQLPPLFPSMADIDTFQDAIRPLLSASAKDNAALASVYHSRDTRQGSGSPSTSATPHLPLTYQALAISLHILSQRARTSFQVRTYWNQLSPYDFCDAENIMPLGGILVSMTTDILDTQLRNMSELEHIQAQIPTSSASASATSTGPNSARPHDPVLSILLKWAEIEALEIVAGLNVRVLFFVILTLAVKQRSLSKLGAYEGFDTLQPEQADMVAELGEWTSWVNERMLRLASSLVTLPPTGPAQPRQSKQAENLDMVSTSADYQASSRYLHIIPQFHFCSVVFVAAKQSVEHKLFVAFGSGNLGSGNQSMLAVFAQAVRSLVTLAQQDQLSLPAIVANVLREFARRYANIVKRSEEVAARDKVKDGSRTMGSSKKTDASKADGAARKAGDTASARFAVRSANAVERVKRAFGDAAHWPPNRHISRSGEVRSASEGREAEGRERHPSDAEGKSNSNVFDEAKTVSSTSVPVQQRHKPHPFDTLWGQQQHQQQPQQQHHTGYGSQMSMQTGNPQTSPPPLNSSGTADYDSRFSALSGNYIIDTIGGGTAGELDSAVPVSLGDYSHAALDQLLGTLDDEFMGFPLDSLYDKDATAEEGSSTESIVNHWEAGSLDNESGQHSGTGVAGGSALPFGFSAHHPHQSSSATYTHNPIVNGAGLSPGASSSYGSDLSAAAVAGGISISRMVSGNGPQPQPPQAQHHVLGSQHAPYPHHGHPRGQVHGRGPPSAGLYSPGPGGQGAYPLFGGHAPASAPLETAPLVSSYASFGDARRGIHTPGGGPLEGGPNGEAKLGPTGGGYHSRSDSGGYYAASGGPGGGGARGSPYPMAYGSGAGGGPQGGAPGAGGAFMQHHYHQHQHQHQQGYQHAASQQYQHQHHLHPQQQQQQQARHR